MSNMTQKLWFFLAVLLVTLLASASVNIVRGLEFPGRPPGEAKAQISPNSLVLENEVISCAWNISEGQLRPAHVRDKLSATTILLNQSECFQIIQNRNRVIKGSELKILGKPDIKKLKPSRSSTRLAERFGGWQITVSLASSDGNLQVQWWAVLRDGSNYIRQLIVAKAEGKPIEIEEIVMLDLCAPKVRLMGFVDGSPVVAGNIFFACEHPISKSRVLDKPSQRFQCSWPCPTTLKPGSQLAQSSVIGVVPEGQLRRGFLYYLERERAQPYQPFLHYNSWYDIAWDDRKMHESECLEVIELFGRQLIERRNITMDSFVFDDGWDDNTTLWQFHNGFPNGFTPLQQAAKKYDSALGVWLSPKGGYSRAKAERLKYGRQNGFETNQQGFSLAGPKYYVRFRDVCINMLKKYKVNYFKFDGIAAGSKVSGVEAEFINDVEALLQLVTDLRLIKPDLFVNITTGTWPSPYWLYNCDSIWRAGADWSTYGWGTKRQQWLTYRDRETYDNVVTRAPLYPLNSLMVQGITFAQRGYAANMSCEIGDLLDEIQTLFASGTNLQELYITPAMMQPKAWDTLAEAAKWSRENSDVLVDTHWVGGDPGAGEVYGWASWARRKGILALRNPHETPRTITIDIGKAFELPKHAPRSYILKKIWQKDVQKQSVIVSAGQDYKFELSPFEVLVFDAIPRMDCQKRARDTQ